MCRLFFILFFCLPNFVIGQQKNIPITLSLFNESTTLPFTKFVTLPIHPGLQIGTEFTYKKRASNRLFQTINTHYFYHNYLAQGIGIGTDFGYEHRSKLGFSAESLIGIGYLHTFTTADEFIFSGNTYEVTHDKGNSRLTPSITFGLGYYLNPTETLSPKLFVRYQAWVEYPYSPDFIPLMSHINLHIGIKFNFTKLIN